MAFQYIFDNAEQLAINNTNIVGQSITRNLSVKAVSRGIAPRVFTVKLPDGLRWSDLATTIQAIEAAGRYTIETIQINNSEYTEWMSGGDIDPLESINIICVELPQWTIFARDQVSWSGAFIFYEVL